MIELLHVIFLVTGSLFFLGIVVLLVCLGISVAQETKRGPRDVPIDYNYPYN